MILSKRSLKHSYQQVLLVAGIFSLCVWLVVGVRTSSASASISQYSRILGDHARWIRHGDQATLHHDTTGFTVEDGDSSHPRLHGRPLPLHASQPDFPNVPISVRLPADDGSHIPEEVVGQYLEAIWELNESPYYRTECAGERELGMRYDILRELALNHHTSEVKYFFALDLVDVRKLIPRLMGTLVQVVKMLGPQKCAISIVEGRSSDGTYAILTVLKQRLESIGVRVYLVQSDINPHGKGVDRIGALAELRNMALAPLIRESKATSGTPIYDHDTLITFMNDIAVCPDDVYELMFQHIYQGAHQTCAMDWCNGGDIFYDGWVSRSMSGDLFFEVPQDVSFTYADNLFWDHPVSRRKFKQHQPLQVYSCWGGMITLTSAPFIDGQVKFRNSTDDECYAGEPLTLAKDLWRLGYGKIATVPSVNVGYNSYETSHIKKIKGWVHTHVPVDRPEQVWKGTELIDWNAKPPGQVKCMPAWGRVSWTSP